MNQDSSYDPPDFDIPALDHSLAGLHDPALPDPLDFHHATDLGSLDLLHHDPLLGSFHPGPDIGISHDHTLGGQVIGEPDSGGVWHQQQTQFTCAVVSQEMVLREFGLHVNEAQLMGEAMQHHWLSETGTPFEDVGKLLELHGVPCHDGQGTEQMMSELAQGHKVIVSVDSTDLWNDSWMARELHDMASGGPHADHAIVVQGLRHNDDGSWHVIVNDSGNPNGEGHDYPLDQFEEAWRGSHCHFVSTDIAPPGLSSHPVFGDGFDQQSGTYPGVMDWLHSHAALAGGLALGTAFLVRPADSPDPRKSEKQRNDMLREI